MCVCGVVTVSFEFLPFLSCGEGERGGKKKVAFYRLTGAARRYHSFACSVDSEHLWEDSSGATHRIPQ